MKSASDLGSTGARQVRAPFAPPVYWLVEDIDCYPASMETAAAEYWLGPEEIDHLDGLRIAKRRADWLLGRLTAKHLIQKMVADQTGSRPALAAIQILRGADGAPRVYIDGYPAVSITISHSECVAFCAGIMREDWPVGADIEQIAPRSLPFARDYFTPEEIAQVDQTDTTLHPVIVNAIWSAKEAALKALRLGLKVDTRALTCHMGGCASIPTDWRSLEIHWDTRYLRQSAPPCVGWWRVMGDKIFTLAVQMH